MSKTYLIFWETVECTGNTEVKAHSEKEAINWFNTYFGKHGFKFIRCNNV